MSRLRQSLLLLGAAAGFALADASAEIVFQDFFTGAAGSITNSVPWIDVEGYGWQSVPGGTQLMLDGAGHIYNAAANAGTAAAVPLIPVGPHGSMTASSLMNLPVGSTEWIGMGFSGTNQFLSASGSGSGPWLQVQGNGSMTLYGGSGLSNAATIATAFTNTGNPVQVILAYDAFHNTASAGIVSSNSTNFVFNQWPITNSAAPATPRYFVFQFSTNLTTATSRWATAAAVDWYPRPPPMLTLPVPILQTNLVGPPGTNDLLLISNALNLVTSSPVATEIRFTAGATYVISNASLTAKIPLALSKATNVVINGNGCEILIANPRIGFLSVNNCSNVIVQGFTVDYITLPFTQGTVTHNFDTSNDTPKEAAIEFQVDPGYPAPTNANYLDSNASRWGMVMDPTRAGRVADGAYTQCFYTNVVQTNANGAFKVYLTSSSVAQTIQPGSAWCMISRWDGSIAFNASQSAQVTFMNNTNYASAGLIYVGEHSSLVCEINDQILPGLPPAGASVPRRRASNADGGLFLESRIGPWVQGCSFTALGDDIANACLAPFIITNAPAYPTNTFALYENTTNVGLPMSLIPFQVEVGDVITFFNGTNGNVFDRANVTAVSLPNVTFDHPITNIEPGNYTSNTLLINKTLNTSAVYLDNQFLNSAFHGIYCRADNMLIAHNSVGGMGKNAICAFPAIATTFLNFFVPTNVVIMDNVLSDEGFSYESVHNVIPTGQPAFGMVALNEADTASDSVTNGFEVSGIRVLYNAFLDWHRAPLTLHNATDVTIAGNYFGPPVTNDGLVALTNDVIADLWSSDYPNLRITNNVNAAGISNADAVNEDGASVFIANAFQQPASPTLTTSLAGTNLLVSWVSPSPGFVLQAIGALGGSNNWVEMTNSPLLAGESNTITFPLPPASPQQFYRAGQR